MHYFCVLCSSDAIPFGEVTSATSSAVVINAIIITTTTTSSTTTTMILFTSHVFLAGSGITILVIQAFILYAGVLLRVCAVLQYMLDVQLFLRPL